MRTMTLKLLLLPFTCSLLFLGCPKDEPCTTCPTPSADTLITFERELADGEQPAVSPDGKKIAYTYNGDIFVMDTSVQTTMWWDGQNWRYDTTGGKITQLTSGAEIDILPRWTPDGQTIGFIRTMSGVENQGVLYSVPATGGATTQITSNQFVADGFIQKSREIGGIGVPIWDWSSDGKYIAFLSESLYTTFLDVVSLQANELVLHKVINEWSTSGSNSRHFVWTLYPNEIAFIVAGSNQKVHLLNFITNEEIEDTVHTDASNLTRLPNQNRFSFQYYSSGSSSHVIVTDFTTVFGFYTVPESPRGHKWSPDEKYFLYEYEERISGPFGYTYSRLFINDTRRNKNYQLTKTGDANRHNLFFEWGKDTNEVYFERFGKINKVIFQNPNN